MKRYNIVAFIGMLCSLIACTEDYTSPFPVSDVAWYTSKPGLSSYAVSQHEMMGFMDASQGALTHQWEIQEGSHFLTSEVEKGDSLALFIDHDKGLVSTEKGVNVYFATPGHYSVRLCNTFAEEVSSSFKGQPKTNQLEDGTWAFDSTFTVDVYEPVHAAFKVCRVVRNDEGEWVPGDVLVEVDADRNPVEEDPETWNSVEVEVGERLMFINLTKDEDETMEQPNKSEWTVFNKAVSTTYKDSVSTVFFNTLGFTKTGLGNLTASRDVEGCPKSSDQKTIPLKVTVIEGTQPFTYADGAIWTSPTSFKFNVTGEMETIGKDASKNFTVHVNNKVFNQNIEVTKVSFDPSDATVVSLEIAEPIYANDTVTVAYNLAGDPCVGTDGRLFKSFEPQKLSFPEPGENLLAEKADFAGFEKAHLNGNTAWCTGYWTNNANATTKEWERISGDGKAPVGEAYMKYSGTIQQNISLSGMDFGLHANLEAGAYVFSHRIFIEEGSTIEKLKTEIAHKLPSWTIVVRMDWDLKDQPRGKWVTIEQMAYLPRAFNTEMHKEGNKSRYAYHVIQSLNPGVDPSTPQVFYLDDMQVSKVPAGMRPE